MRTQEQFDYKKPELKEFDYKDLAVVHGDSCALALSDSGVDCKDNVTDDIT